MGRIKKEEMTKELLKLAAEKYMEARGRKLLEEVERMNKNDKTHKNKSE
jgi:mannose/fructose/N-acetylgalactosamine-specific phosphotransferase system component IIB